MEHMRRELLVSLFLVLATLAIYWQVSNHEFVHLDDYEHISENRHLREGVTLESVRWAFSFTDVAYWHPMTWLSLMLDYEISGLSPKGYHLTNLLLHILSALFLFLALNRMTGSLWQSAFVASLFAFHPLNVESVAWAVERKNVLSCLFWMLTLWSYARYVERSTIGRYLLILIVFALGLMSKPTLVTLPFVLLLLDYWPLNRIQLVSSAGHLDQPSASPAKADIVKSLPFRLVREKLPFFAFSAMAIVITVLSNQYLGSLVTTDSAPLSLRIGNGLISYMGYVGKMIWPSNLAIYYPPPETISWWQLAVAVLFLTIVSLVVSRTVKTRPYLAVGWLWYLGTLVPSIGLVRAGMWPAMADRFAYVPLIGLFIMVAWGVPDLMGGRNYAKPALAVAAASLLGALMVCTFLQVRYWENSLTLFEHTLRVTNNNSQIHNNLANVLTEKGMLQEAIPHYTKALEINPNNADAHTNLGVALAHQGKLEDAIKHYSEALRLKPNSPELHNNLGVALFRRGHIPGAIDHYLTAVQLKPDYAEAYNNLGNALAQQEELVEAEAFYAKALKIRADYPEAHNNLGVALARQGKLDVAIAHFREAVRLKPDYLQARANLQFALEEIGNSSR